VLTCQHRVMGWPGEKY